MLALYRRDPAAFASLAQEYRSEFVTGRPRSAPPVRLAEARRHGLPQLRRYPRRPAARRLVRALDRPEYFGYSLARFAGHPADLEYFQQASPAALGTLTYIAFETRRLFERDATDRARSSSRSKSPSLVEPEDIAPSLKASRKRCRTARARSSTSIIRRCRPPNWSACGSS